MTDVSNRKRQPKGIPVGGEFAANEHDEAMSSLDAAIARDNIVAIDAAHFDAVQKAVGEKGSLVTRLDAEELLSAESGTRPRMYGLIQREDNDQYEIVSLKSQYDLDRHDTVAQWVSGTTVADLISPAKTETASDRLIADAEGRWEHDRAEYLSMRDEPTSNDYHETFDTIAADISNDSFPNGANSWNTVMGASARRTQANIDKYNQHLGRVAGNDPEYRAKHTSYAKTRASLNSYARAYETGVAAHPVAVAYFEEVWNDPEHSHGEAKLREQQAQNAFDRDALMIGTLKPSKVVGTGYRNPKQVASEYLERRRVEIDRALATRGRSQSTLASNALGREKRALAGE